jgi:hypothetical protein
MRKKLFFLALVVACMASVSQAQTARSGKTLLSVEDVEVKRLADAIESPKLDALLLERVGAEDLQSDIVSSRWDLRRVEIRREIASDAGDLEDFDAEEGRRAASRGFTIQAVKQMQAVVEASPSSANFHALKESFDDIQNTIRWSIADNGGELKFSHGKSDDSFADLELSANIRDGIRPQVSFGELLKAQYQPSNGALWLKLDYNF